MDTIGYVTNEEALIYIQGHYTSKDPLRVNWESLTEDDQNALLRRSLQSIEMLPFAGRKYDSEQSLAFPRCPSQTIPEGIKAAQIENALSLGDTSNQEEEQFYSKLWMYGVESYSIGNLSESVGAGAGTGAAQTTGIVSSTAQRLLKPFLSGGYRIWGG